MAGSAKLQLTYCARIGSIHGMKYSSACISSCIKKEQIKQGWGNESPQNLQYVLCSEASRLNVRWHHKSVGQQCLDIRLILRSQVRRRTHKRYFQWDGVSFEYLPTKTRATHVRCLKFAKLCKNCSVLLLLFESFITEAGTRKNLGISHLN